MQCVLLLEHIFVYTSVCRCMYNVMYNGDVLHYTNVHHKAYVFTYQVNKGLCLYSNILSAAGQFLLNVNPKEAHSVQGIAENHRDLVNFKNADSRSADSRTCCHCSTIIIQYYPSLLEATNSIIFIVLYSLY